MKALTLLIALCISFSIASAQTGWYRQDSNTKDDLRYLAVPTKDTLYMSGGGSLLRTTNAGITWMKLLNPRVAGMHFFDGRTGFVGSPSQWNINFTSNGCETWEVFDTHIEGIDGVIFIGRDTGYAYNNINFSRTTNGGKSWGLNGALIGFHDMHFSDSRHGCVVGEQKLFSPNPNLPSAGGFMKTTNAGETWKEFYTGIEDEFWAVWMIDSNIIIACASQGLMGKSVDGGETWKKIETGSTEVFNDVMFPTSNTGYATASGGRIIKTTDQGETWTELKSTVRRNIDTSANINLNCVFFADSLSGWIGGTGGTILHTADGGKLWVRQFLPKPLTTSVSPEPFGRKTSITYELPSAMKVKIRIYDVMGKELEVLESPGIQDVGTHSIEFDASRYPEGTFHYQIQTDGFYGTGKMTKVVY